MYNYGNLSDVEFEELCRCIMSDRLGVKLRTFTRGRDGGIDICDTPQEPNVMIQVKHYFFSDFPDLKRSLARELRNVKQKNPKQYYVCTSAGLTPDNVIHIKEMFSAYMDSTECVLGRNDIDAILSEQGRQYLLKFPKLGITSELLNSVLHNDAMIDVEVLFDDIEEDCKRFVATRTYYKAFDTLLKNRILILTGNPGVGKSMTSKMLCLKMKRNHGYKIIYVSDHNIKESKTLLSREPDERELVFLDDCFGQRYFEMKGETGEELISLIKYVRKNKNKSLLMNSRVSIYREARNRFMQFDEAVNNRELYEVVVDMNNISVVEKAQIFYNHLYFAKVPTALMTEIRADYNYRKIVNHRNYNPRLIKHITMKSAFENADAKAYVSNIFDLLNNPKDIWADEYINKLTSEDRIFMNTLFSITDRECLSSIHKRAYYNRLKYEDIDTSSDPWLLSKNRLIGSMLKIIEKDGDEYLSAADPSVNDYLDACLKTNIGEIDKIISTATEYQQYTRLSPDSIVDKIIDGSILELHFANDDIRRECILSAISDKKIINEVYKPLVLGFYHDPCILVPNQNNLLLAEVYMCLLHADFDKVYNTKSSVNDESLNKLILIFDIEELPVFFDIIEQHEQAWLLEKYEKIICVSVNELIEIYLEDANISDFCDVDVFEVLKDNTVGFGIDSITDFRASAQEILDNATNNILSQLEDIISKLPEPFCSKFDIYSSVKKYLGFTISDADTLISDSVDEPDYDDLYDYYRENMIRDHSTDLIDGIFQER